MSHLLTLPSLAFLASCVLTWGCSGESEENQDANTPDENVGGTGSSPGTGAASSGGDTPGDMIPGANLADIDFLATKFCAVFERCDLWLYRSYGTGQECIDFYKSSQLESLRLEPRQAALYSQMRKEIESCDLLETQECPLPGHIAQLRWFAATLGECLADVAATPGDVCDDASCGHGLICSGASTNSCGTCEEASANWCNTSSDCPENAHCDFDTNTCLELHALGEVCESLSDCSSGQCRDGKCSQPAAMGAACDQNNACELSLRCVSGTCTQLGGDGSDCTTHEDCRYAFACNAGSCEKLPGSGIALGAACRFSGCIEGAYCDITDNTCKGGGLGDTCTYRCAGTLSCVDGVCAGPQAQGAPCDADGECQSGRCFAEECAEAAECRAL